ncbi:metal ABC transporter permease [Rhodoblastus acidophilus]|uniref:Metal ABC transporter permease n=1 Tax=Rhodoblastus acidophilus TaxID=1074 RepID=A0A6N8DP10_RHOAC|nr:metal ABC transporter permease [Rhodoblastus acidophilus]MCW2275242.1 zinc/manganese transport system permease protein [Rhodoblastus acidophilus]MTV32209.1 metal ABC transporter permease [Rhodoblastus acidophilus]
MLYAWLVAPFADYEFMRRALIGAWALALAGAPLGVFLLLRRMALSGDALAHAILPGAALGYLVAGLSLPAMTLGGVLAGFAVALGSGAVARATVLREEASLAAFYLISLALGVTLVSVRGSNVDLLHVLFGSVLALDDATLILLAAIASVTLVGLAAIYRPLALDTLDPGFLASVSRAGAAIQSVFLMLVALNLVAGFHALGTLLSVGMMMLPAISARLWTQNMSGMIALAALFGLIGAYAGLLASYHWALPSGPLIILACGGLYVLSLVAGPAGGMLRRFTPRSHLEG